jgi:cytochrome c5
MSVEHTRGRAPRARPRQIASATLAGVALLALAGCGAGGARTAATGSGQTSVPAYVTEPFTQEQQLVEKGARLVVSDGCAACHLNAPTPGGAPDFTSFAGHRVRLRDGREVLVDERYVREGLLHPLANEISGYDPAPMLAALARLRLGSQPAQVSALAAFIEQVGPETE